MSFPASPIIVTGANGNLGLALLKVLGPARSIAATRRPESPLPEFKHVQLGPDGELPSSLLSGAAAVINAAGRVHGSAEELSAVNVALAASLARQARDASVPKFVQVGSLSVYGNAEWIDGSTRTDPVTAYGHSKLLADRAILAMADADFAVETVRLPFMFSAAQPALLANLIALGNRLRVLPTKRQAMQRSMITYADAAQVLLNAAESSASGAALAADPQLFDLPLLVRLVAEETGKRWHMLTLADGLVAALRVVAPQIDRRLFRNSIISPQANIAGTHPLSMEASLRQIIRAILL